MCWLGLIPQEGGWDTGSGKSSQTVKSLSRTPCPVLPDRKMCQNMILVNLLQWKDTLNHF
jgi:hypothetical protein